MIMRKIFISGLLLIPLCLLIFNLPLPAAGQSSASYSIVADVVDVEGGEKTSSNYILLDSMGQGIEGGEMASTGYTFYAGFNGFQGEGLPTEYFVDCVNGDANNGGLSWADAKASITGAITELNGRSGTIYVAQGTCTENTTLTPDLTLMGGYDAQTGQRDINNYVTVIDGEYDNAHVVTGADDATIDGFTITQGYSQFGGGIYCNNITNFTVRNNTIENNKADKGAGIYIGDYSVVLVESNSIIGNRAEQYIPAGRNEFLVTNFAGGGIYVGNYSTPTITGNIIKNNTSAQFGGGIYIITWCDPTSIINNMITENAADAGGGIYIGDQSQASVVNNTIADNVATWGGGIYKFDSDLTITNCTVWGNGDDLEGINPDCSEISYSNIEDGDCFEVSGNISCDPDFFGGGNYHITSVSCCIDAGTDVGAPSTDIDGDNRIAPVDIGADEYTNYPPNTPSDPWPAAGATGVERTPNLSWDGGDPDGASDTVDYFIYLDESQCGSSVDPTTQIGTVQFSGDQIRVNYTTSLLEPCTCYYWKVVARDSQGAEALGPVWCFKTKGCGCDPVPSCQ